ncbi:MAG: S26 family signal peptidase [Actinomycetes bacterium]
MTLLPIRTWLPFPIRRVKISGRSMLPTFQDGTVLYFRGGATLRRVGQIVLIERESYPGIFYIKRITSITSEGIWVEGDNLEESTDSRKWGYLSPEEIIAVAFRHH